MLASREASYDAWLPGEHVSLDRHEVSWRERIPSQEIAGISTGAVAAFCDAIEFGVHAERPTEGELEALRAALRRIARESRASGLTAERMLIGLKAVWTRVCQRQPSPDMHDPAWHIVTRESVRAFYEEGS
jgi:hypothetical protein